MEHRTRGGWVYNVRKMVESRGPIWAATKTKDLERVLVGIYFTKPLHYRLEEDVNPCGREVINTKLINYQLSKK